MMGSQWESDDGLHPHRIQNAWSKNCTTTEKPVFRGIGATDRAVEKRPRLTPVLSNAWRACQESVNGVGQLTAEPRCTVRYVTPGFRSHHTAMWLYRILRRFLKKNLPRCGPRRCGQTPRLPPAGGGPTPPHGVGGRRAGVEMRGEPSPEIT